MMNPKFICLKCYNPLTTQGERERYININQIVFIEELTEFTQHNNRVKNLKSRITFSTGEILDIKESNHELQKIINEAKF